MSATDETLGGDAKEWKDARDKFRKDLSDPFINGLKPYLDTSDDEPEIEGPDYGDVGNTDNEYGNQQGTKYKCQVQFNNNFENAPTALYPDESDEHGWPTADNVIASLKAQIASGGNMSKIILQLRQMNTLESFRRTLVNEKQRRPHLVRHWQELLNQTNIMAEELEKLLLNQPVGTKGTADA
jgi:hypothetical protein